MPSTFAKAPVVCAAAARGLQLCQGVSGLSLWLCAHTHTHTAAGVDGTTLKEAKYINLSLHYLEQVIIALQERSMGLGR